MSDLNELIDRMQIEQQILRVGAMLDDQTFDDARQIFAEEVEIETPGGQASGIEAVVAQARRNHESYVTQHLITNVLIGVDGDHADARADVIGNFIPRRDTGSERRTLAGRYSYEFSRRPGGWRITRLEMRPIWQELQAA